MNFTVTLLGVAVVKGLLIGQDEIILKFIGDKGEVTGDEIKTYLAQFKWLKISECDYMKIPVCPNHKTKMNLPKGTGHWRCEKCLNK